MAERDELLQRFREREVDDAIAHHVIDTAESDRVETYDDAVHLSDRRRHARLVGAFHGIELAHLFAGQRWLSPRRPYLSAPLSYTNAMGLSWALWAEADKLEWATVGEAPAAKLEFWFRDVEVGKEALVTVHARIGASGPGVTGHVEVRSSDGSPRLFPVTGYKSHVLDIRVVPDHPFATLVTVEPKEGVGYLAWERTVFSVG